MPLSYKVGAGHKIEAYGVKGMENKRWRKSFKDQAALDKWCEANDATVEGTADLTKGLKEAKKVKDDDYFIVIPDDMPGRDHMDLYTEKAFPSYDAAESYIERLKRSAMNSRDADTDEGDEELEELENVDIVSGARLKSKYPKLFEGLNEAKSEIAQHRANLKKVINAWHTAVGGHAWIPETKANYKKLFGVQPGDENEDDLNFTPEDYAQEAFDGYIHSVYPDKKAKDAIVYDVDWGSARRSACISFLKKLLKSRNIKYDVKGNRDGVVFTPL